MPQPSSNSSSLVPVQASQDSQSLLAMQSSNSGLKAKTSALAEELAILRSNLDIQVNQLQALIEQEGAAAERAELLNAVVSRMRESLNLQDVFNRVVEDARIALEADRVIVYQFDPHWKGTVVAESVDPQWPASLGAEIADPCFADRYVAYYQKGRVKAIANIEEAGLTECHLKQLKPFAVKANLITPILMNEKLMGLLIAHQCDAPRDWTESEIEFFRLLAIQLGYAVDQALLLQQQQAATQQAQRLNQIYSQIRKSLNRGDILTTTVEETREALHSDRVIVYQFDNHWQGTIVAESVLSNWPVSLGAQITDPCFAERYVQSYLRGRVNATANIEEAGLTECHLKQLKPFAVKANLVAPIVVNQNLMGLLIAHQCAAPRQWTDLEIDLIRNVALQLGYVLDQALLLEQQQAAARQARLLNEITARLRSSQKTEDVFDAIVEETRDALKADRVMVYQFDAQWQGTVVAESVDRKWPTAMGKKIADPCFKDHFVKPYFRGRVSKIENIAESGLGECYVKLLEPFAVKANIVAPIIAEAQLHGLFIVHQCSGPRQWQESEITFVKQLATQIGFALDQISLLQQQQTATEQARRLNHISSRIRESLNPQDIINRTVEETQDALQADRVIVYQFDGNWQGTVVAESVNPGWPVSLGAKIADPCFAEQYVKPYLKGRVRAISNLEEAGLTDCHLNQLRPFKVKANLVAPILSEHKLYGLLIAHQCSHPRPWMQGEIDLIRQIAIQVGYALDQAFLLQQQQIATQQARRFSEISSRIRETLDPERIFTTTVKECLQLMQTDRIVIYRFDESWDGKIIAEAVKPGILKIGDLHTEVPCFPVEFVEPYRQGRIQVTPDITTAGLTACHLEQLRKWQVKSNVVVPILVNQTLYGLLGAHQCSSPRQWLESEVETFKQVASQVGYALEQAVLLEQVQQARHTAELLSQEQQQKNEQLQQQIESFLTQIEGSFDGDLTVRAGVTEGVMGTVADFFNATIENLQRLVLQVQEATGVVTATVQSNETEIQQLSSEALRQAEAIATALKSVEIFTNSVQGVARNTQATNQKVQEASQTLQTGDVAMNRTVEAILAIQKAVYAAARKVKNLGDASKKISRVVSLIGEIASQTNILALNASVEASRVSQEDQGFASVAGEIRNLAEQSANAAQEIEQILEEIQAETNDVVQVMEVGLKRVIIGTKLVQGTRKTLTELVEISQQIQSLIAEISDSTIVQAKTSVALTNTMQEVAGIANQTSAQSLAVANSFNQLLEVAGQLQTSVAQFKVTVGS